MPTNPLNLATETKRAIKSLRGIYRRARGRNDDELALKARIELSKVLQLHKKVELVQDASTEGGEARESLAKIAEHILPLKLAPAEYPLHEHVRIAVELIREQRAGKGAV